MNNTKSGKWKFDFELLKKHDIPFLEYGIAKNISQASKIASNIGYPVALKLFSEKFLHKSEHHALSLNIKDEKTLQEEFLRLRKISPEPILVQKYTPASLEFIIGGKYDPQFGPTILFGIGGVFTNLISDYQIRICPLSESDARSMIANLKAYPILKGYRGFPKVNLTQLTKILLNVSKMLYENDIEELDLNPVLNTPEGLFVADIRALFVKRKNKPIDFNKNIELRPQVKNLKYIFEPSSVAIVGASKNPSKIGHIILKNFIDLKFEGKIYPVNLHEKEILGLKCYKKVSDIPSKVDCAIISIPANSVYSVLKDCVKAKVPSAIVISGGFSEVGNKKEELKIKKLADKHQIALIGPNCMGVINTATKVDSVFLSKEKLPRPQSGSISIISQSGALGGVLLDLAQFLDVPISKFVSYGNALCIDESDLLAYLMHDEKTKTIGSYIEGVRDGRKFMQAAQKLSCNKPLVVLKGAKTKAGGGAASSHTATMAGSFEVFSSALKQASGLQVQDINELFDFIKMLNFEQETDEFKIINKHFFGSKVAVLTNGGGAGVLAADAIEENNLELAQFSKKTILKLKKVLNPNINITNPLDILGDATAKNYKDCLKIFAEDSNIDAIVCIILFQTPTLDDSIIEVLKEAKTYIKRPFFVIASGGVYTQEQIKKLNQNSIAVFSSPLNGIKALAASRNYNFFCKIKT